jgi:hypothetical protein
MRRNSTLRWSAALATLVLGMLVAPVASAETTVTREAYANFVLVGCIASENILFEGTLQSVSSSFVDPAGNTHGKLMVRVVNASGIGQTTGNHYRLVSGSTFTVNSMDPNGGSAGTIRVRFIGQGAVAWEDFNVRLTITPDGQIQVLRIESEFGCHSPDSA